MTSTILRQKIDKKEEEVIKKEEEITKKEKEMAKKEKEMAKKEKEMAKKEAEITEKEKEMAKKEKDITKKEKDITKKEKDSNKTEEITELETKISTKEKVITNLEEISREKDLLLASCQKELEETKRKLEDQDKDSHSKEPKMIQYLNEELFKAEEKCAEMKAETLRKEEEAIKERKELVKNMQLSLDLIKKLEVSTEMVKARDVEIKSLKAEKEQEVRNGNDAKELKESLNIEKDALSILENKFKILKNDIMKKNDIMQKKAEQLKKATILLETSDKKQKDEIGNLKEIVTAKEEMVANLVAVIEEHGCLKTVANGGGDEIDRELALFEKIADATGESLEQVIFLVFFWRGSPLIVSGLRHA